MGCRERDRGPPPGVRELGIRAALDECADDVRKLAEWAAKASAVRPFASRIFGSAPPSRSIFTSASRPFTEAAMRGDCRWLSSALICAPASRRIRETGVLPWRAANKRAVAPSLSFAFTAALCFMSKSTRLGRPALAASMRGVIRSVRTALTSTPRASKTLAPSRFALAEAKQRGVPYGLSALGSAPAFNKARTTAG